MFTNLNNGILETIKSLWHKFPLIFRTEYQSDVSRVDKLFFREPNTQESKFSQGLMQITDNLFKYFFGQNVRMCWFCTV